MWYKFLLLLTVSQTRCQHFSYIEVRYIKNNVVFLSSYVDNVNFEMEVTDIWIENQTVPRLKNGSFQNLPKLKFIKIQKCGLQEIDSNAFDNVPSLRVLNLNNNALKTIRSRSFEKLSITKLYLGMNGLESLHPEAFYNIPDLEVLDLSNNNLKVLHSHMFKGTPNLRQIDLSFNIINVIPKKCFEETFTNVGLGDDSFINLSDNQLEAAQFDGIYNLEELNLMNNNIEKMDPNIFKKINIKSLNLQNNQLTDLDDRILKDLEPCKIINVDGNPWNCRFVHKFKNWCDNHKKENTLTLDLYKECF